MPAKSKAQQALFGIALAVRRGDLARSKVNKEVLDIVDSDMTNKEIEDFASTSHKGLRDHIKESISKDSSLSKTDRVFIVIKPEFTEKMPDILKMFEEEGFRVIASKHKKLTLAEAKRLYRAHAQESFYEDLCNYMSSAASVGVLLLPPNKQYYDLFKVVDMLKDQVRKKFGKDEMRNAIHGSDSLEHMKQESKIYF